MRSRFPHFRPMAAVVAVLFFFRAASAHDIKEMTAWARVFPDRVEVVITVSTHMATVLLTRPDEPPANLTPETIGAFRERLEAQAKEFCTLHSGTKKVLVLRSLDVVMDLPEEVSFYLTYPAAGTDPLRFEMVVLNRLEAGNQIALVVLDARRKPLGGKLLRRDTMSLEVSPAGSANAPSPEPVPPSR